MCHIPEHDRRNRISQRPILCRLASNQFKCFRKRLYPGNFARCKSAVSPLFQQHRVCTVQRNFGKMRTDRVTRFRDILRSALVHRFPVLDHSGHCFFAEKVFFWHLFLKHTSKWNILVFIGNLQRWKMEIHFQVFSEPYNDDTFPFLGYISFSLSVFFLFYSQKEKPRSIESSVLCGFLWCEGGDLNPQG